MRVGNFALAAIAASFVLLGSFVARAETTNEAALLKALNGIPVTLQEGLKASEIAGQPISAKFEIENGRLQLSVYTTSTDGYREALISTFTGVLMSAEKITDGDDLAEAKAQSQAMREVKTSLRAVVENVSTQAKRSRVVSVVPEMSSGHPVAKISVARDGGLTTVSEDIR